MSGNRYSDEIKVETVVVESVLQIGLDQMQPFTSINWKCILLCLALSFASTSVASPSEGEVPPVNVGKTIASEPVLLSAYSGKVVVVTFWATWCTYCRNELKTLERLQGLVGDENIRVIAVNIESRDTFRRVMKTLRGFKMLLAYDPSGSSAKTYGVNTLPHMLIIGRDGRVLRVYEGYGEGRLEDIIADVNQALKAPMPTVQ